MKLLQGNETLLVDELKLMSAKMFGRLVKAVVDVEKQVMVIDADFHADQEFFLLERDSLQEHLWGINLHPDKFGTDDFIEFDSMINFRFSAGNRTRGVDNPKTQEQIKTIVYKFVRNI